jgi:hypothetical protein
MPSQVLSKEAMEVIRVGLLPLGSGGCQKHDVATMSHIDLFCQHASGHVVCQEFLSIGVTLSLGLLTRG